MQGCTLCAIREVVLLRKDVEPASEDADQMSAASRGHYLKEEAAPWVHPFWRITTSTDEKEVNMKLTTKEAPDESEVKVKVPVLMNTKKISTGDQLLYYSSAKDGVAEKPQKKKARQ